MRLSSSAVPPTVLPGCRRCGRAQDTVPAPPVTVTGDRSRGRPGPAEHGSRRASLADLMSVTTQPGFRGWPVAPTAQQRQAAQADAGQDGAAAGQLPRPGRVAEHDDASDGANQRLEVKEG